MSRRGYKVISEKAIEKLIQNPFAGWLNPEISSVDPSESAADYIRTVMGLWGEGSRSQIAVMFDEVYGHSFIAEQGKYANTFIDPQEGKQYTVDEINAMLGNVGKIDFSRIDQLELTNLGESSCKEASS